MVPVVSNLLEDLLLPSAPPIVRTAPVVNHKFDELNSEINHKYIHDNPYNQGRSLSKSIDKQSEDVD